MELRSSGSYVMSKKLSKNRKNMKKTVNNKNFMSFLNLRLFVCKVGINVVFSTSYVVTMFCHVMSNYVRFN